MYSQRHIDRQDIHAVGGVEGDLSNRLADDGCKVRIIGIEAQLGAAPDIGHMMQAILAAIGGGQLHSNTLHGSLGGVDFAKLPLAAQQFVPCGNVVGRSLAELIVPQSH